MPEPINARCTAFLEEHAAADHTAAETHGWTGKIGRVAEPVELLAQVPATLSSEPGPSSAALTPTAPPRVGAAVLNAVHGFRSGSSTLCCSARLWSALSGRSSAARLVRRLLAQPPLHRLGVSW